MCGSTHQLCTILSGRIWQRREFVLVDQIQIFLNQRQRVAGRSGDVLLDHAAVPAELHSPKALNIVFYFVGAVKRLLRDLAGGLLFDQSLDRVGKGRPAGLNKLRVSPSPSKIPYGGFSPVRLQMDRQWRPSTTARGLSAVHMRPMTPSYTPPQFSLPGIRDPRRDYPF